MRRPPPTRIGTSIELRNLGEEGLTWRRKLPLTRKITGGEGRHQPAPHLLTRHQPLHHAPSAGENRRDEGGREEGFVALTFTVRSSIGPLTPAARVAVSAGGRISHARREANRGTEKRMVRH
jgi:hypothetical protein